jgi:hypothetical protein
MFSELGDLLAPRRRRIRSQLLAALQCIRAWMSAGVCLPNQSVCDTLSNSDINRLYSLDEWQASSDDDGN